VGRFTIPLFARRAVYTVAADRLYAALSGVAEVGVFDMTGSLERIIRDGTADLALAEEFFQRRVRELFERRTGEPMPPSTTYDIPIPSMMPPFSAFIVDDRGYLWVAPFAEMDEDAESWKVFDESGRLLGSVVVPPRFRPFEIKNGEILGRRLDDLDVELVERYEIRQ
jgi:hypothetical protein